MQRVAYVLCGIGPHPHGCLPCGCFYDSEAEVLDPWPALEVALEQAAEGATALTLTDQFFGEEAGADLIQALAENGTVQVLQLNGCGLGDKFARELRKTLMKNVSLKILDLDFNCISDAGINDLSAALRVNQGLRELELNENEISSDGAKYLAQALTDNMSLNKLSLHGNYVGDEGASMLARALLSNEGLLRLVLERNDIGDVGAAELARGVSHNGVLQVLSLGKNSIADEGAKALAQMLKENKCLLEFQLDDNLVSDEGAEALAVALESNSMLVELWLVDNSFSSRTIHRFGAALMRNKVLKRLGLSTTKSGVGSANLNALHSAHKKRRWQAQSGMEDGPIVVTPTMSPWSGAGLLQALPGVKRRFGAWHSAWVPEVLLSRDWDPTPVASSCGSSARGSRAGSRAASLARSFIGSLRGSPSRSPGKSPRSSPSASRSPHSSPRESCSPRGSRRGSPSSAGGSTKRSFPATPSSLHTSREHSFREHSFREHSFREHSFREHSFREHSFQEHKLPEDHEISSWEPTFREQSFRELSFGGQLREDSFRQYRAQEAATEFTMASTIAPGRGHVPPLRTSIGLQDVVRPYQQDMSSSRSVAADPSLVGMRSPLPQARMPVVSSQARRRAREPVATSGLRIFTVIVKEVAADVAFCKLRVRGSDQAAYETDVVQRSGDELCWGQGPIFTGVQEGDVMELEVWGCASPANHFMLCKGVVPLARECFEADEPTCMTADLSGADMERIDGSLEIKMEVIRSVPLEGERARQYSLEYPLQGVLQLEAKGEPQECRMMNASLRHLNIA